MKYSGTLRCLGYRQTVSRTVVLALELIRREVLCHFRNLQSEQYTFDSTQIRTWLAEARAVSIERTLLDTSEENLCFCDQ